jgi:peroxiredoxin
MARSENLYALPENLPVPIDDGASAHLPGMSVPPIALPSTAGDLVRLDDASADWRLVVFCYPRTGRPDRDPPKGWNEIPGARGCTPQSIGFRDHYGELAALHARVYGLSTQTTEYQREAATRLHLPFPLLSDVDVAFTRALRLPTFEVESMVLLKRLTLVIRGDRIEKVFYPIFPPNRNAEEVVAWLVDRNF